MFKKILLTIITLNLIFISTVYSRDRAGAIESIKETLSANRFKATDYSKGLKHFAKALKYENKEKFKKAEKYYKASINYFLEHNKEFVVEPNIFFYIGFSYEGIEDLDNANLYYQIGLELEPGHVNINTRLAELYITENKLNFAKQRLEALKNCDCKEYNQLKEKISKISK